MGDAELGSKTEAGTKVDWAYRAAIGAADTKERFAASAVLALGECIIAPKTSSIPCSTNYYWGLG